MDKQRASDLFLQANPEFQYLLKDRDTVVNFDAPTEVLREYLVECKESIREIKEKILNFDTWININEGNISVEDHGRYNRLRKALIIQHALRSRLTSVLHERELQDESKTVKALREEIERKDKKIEGLRIQAELLNDALARRNKQFQDFADMECTTKEVRLGILFMRAAMEYMPKNVLDEIWQYVRKMEQQDELKAC